MDLLFSDALKLQRPNAFSIMVKPAGPLCNLKCTYCDTEHAQGNKGKKMSVDDVYAEIQNFGNKNVTITGGEPLLQLDDLTKLCLMLVNNGNRVSIETNGSIKLPEDVTDDAHYEVWKYVNFVVDFKLKSYLTGVLQFLGYLPRYFQ